MIRISQILWDAESTYHIAKHDVTPNEVEDAVFDGDPVILKGKENRYILLSQTGSGRYLMIVTALKMRGRIRIITARGMNSKEKA